MKFFTLLFLLAFTTIGCRQVPGALTVTEAMDIEYKGDVEMSLVPGEYDANIKINQNRRSTKVTIKVRNGDFKEKLKFKTKERINIPNNGEFTITADQSRLNVDLAGTVETNTEDLGRYDDWQSCTYTVRERHCHWERDRDGNDRRVCRWYDRQYNGHQNVVYDLYETNQIVTMDIVGEGSNESAPATFFADNTWRERVDRWQSDCR